MGHQRHVPVGVERQVVSYRLREPRRAAGGLGGRHHLARPLRHRWRCLLADAEQILLLLN